MQWVDYDCDGFGDNFSGNEFDVCMNCSGFLMYDRYGCFDLDGDGYFNLDLSWFFYFEGFVDVFLGGLNVECGELCVI